MDEKPDLLSLSIEELKVFLSNLGQESFRTKQITRWLSAGIKDFNEMTDLSKDFRNMLKKSACIGRLEVYRKAQSEIDGTTKYIFRLSDGNIIESVLMVYKYGLSACISSQVGCRMGCRFCASTGLGLVRNLSSGEMLDQILSIQKDCGSRIGNVVIMGIGEPFDNYDNVMKFIRQANLPEGLNLGYRHITISTCGLVPRILALAKEQIPINLSISLHAPNDIKRQQIMPIGKIYSIDKIVEACKIYTETTKRRVTFEYALVDGFNDSEGDALELARKIKGMLCHVNLIPLNKVEGTGLRPVNRQKAEMFMRYLENYNIAVTIRRELGTDINAACGQLRRNVIEDKNAMTNNGN
ncbi:MAG TPA: 23S rRNA (adenine(2503)-C(2))-methyltransferase RlmN [Clostridiales bacterium]|nr:23S rRNA (adenine(2503)-C(2))-methyltransferase RlmN [Clostridiales bacterium]